jgi:hypothetical protein
MLLYAAHEIFMKKIRLIGDVHGYLHFRGSQQSYFNLLGEAEHSVQLGDLGWQNKWNPTFNQDMDNLFPKHMRLYGNHDGYDYISKNALGDFGVHTFPGFEFFYIRGARSIDRAERTPTVDWWLEEELTWEQGHECVQAFREKKPEIVLSHDCPEEALYLMAEFGKWHLSNISTSITNQIMQSCFETHKPAYWIHGHHHLSYRKKHKGTTFIGLDGHMPTIGHNMAYVDFDENGKLITPFPL